MLDLKETLEMILAYLPTREVETGFIMKENVKSHIRGIISWGRVF